LGHISKKHWKNYGNYIVIYFLGKKYWEMTTDYRKTLETRDFYGYEMGETNP